MSAPNASVYESLPLTPLGRHVDSLCKNLAFGNLGHTPRPSATEKAYITGFRDFTLGHYESALKNLSDALALARKDHAKISNGNNTEMLGLILGALGFIRAPTSPDEAAELYKEAYGIWESIHGKNSPKLVFFLMDISSLYKMGEKLDLSIDYCERARDIIQQTSGPDALELQGILINLATLKSQQGKNDEAEKLFQSVISSLEKHKHPNVLMALKIYLQHLEHCKDPKAAEVKARIQSMEAQMPIKK